NFTPASRENSRYGSYGSRDDEADGTQNRCGPAEQDHQRSCPAVHTGHSVVETEHHRPSGIT
ncbi:MAG: hypothetical protein WB699_02140, partial [Bacteroidota bacterium]